MPVAQIQTFVTDYLKCVNNNGCVISVVTPDLSWWVWICCLQLQPPWWWRFFQTRSTCPRMVLSLSGVRCPAVLHTISTGPERMGDPSPAVPRDADRVPHVLHYIKCSDLITSVHRCLISCCSSVCAGAELYFPNVQPSDAGVYVCTCRDQRSTNRSRAEIVVTSVYGLTALSENTSSSLFCCIVDLKMLTKPWFMWTVCLFNAGSGFIPGVYARQQTRDSSFYSDCILIPFTQGSHYYWWMSHLGGSA